MAEKKKMSLEDILAACRGSDTGGAAPSVPAATGSAAETESGVQAAPAPVSAASSPPADTTKPSGPMSVADILAAARKADSSAESVAKPSKPVTAKPAGTPAGKKPGEMSITDILAAARGDGGTAKPTAEPKNKPAAAAKAKPTAAPKPAAAVGKKSAGSFDTSSILAAARKSDKAGPMSKSEAAAQGQAPTRPASARPMPRMPEKPAYAQATSVAESTDRRSFFAIFLGSFLALGFTAFGLTGLLWTLGLARFMFPNILIEPPSQFKVGFASDFAPGGVETKYVAQYGIWVVNTDYEGLQQIVALKTVCTHLGCTPNWLEAEQKFKCPCHGSGFYKDGVNFEGPAPRPLERYAIRVAEDGQLEVDKSKTYQQEMGQWADPSCYVPV
jgi:cytochrome b6-f complex iron-sulfur subunit